MNFFILCITDIIGKMFVSLKKNLRHSSTYYKSHHFKVYNSVVLVILTRLYNYCLYLIHHFRRKTG